MCVASPAHLARSEQNLLRSQLQYDVWMGADKNPCGCHFTKHRVENGPVPPVLNRIKPDEDTVHLHELVTYFCTRRIVINSRLRVYSCDGKSSEQIGEPVVFGRCVLPRLMIARVQNRDTAAIRLAMHVSFHPSLTPSA